RKPPVLLDSTIERRGLTGGLPPARQALNTGQPPMNFRTTAILFGIVFAIGVVLLVLSLRDEDKTGAGDVLAAELVAGGAKPADIDSVEFEKADGGTL